MRRLQSGIKLRKGTKKHIEDELYSYIDTKEEAKQIRSNLFHHKPLIETPEVAMNKVSDPTARIGTYLADSHRLKHMERITGAIEKVFAQLPREKQKMVQLRYFTGIQTLTWEGIAQQVNISRARVFVWREEVIDLIARELGWW